MRLQKARVQNYWSIRDSGWFDIESKKTILVGPNEAGKTALLRVLEQINPPDNAPGFDQLRDFPRSELSDLKLDESSRGTTSPNEVTVVEAHFSLDDSEQEAVTQIDECFAGCSYVVGRRLDNSSWHKIQGGPVVPTYGDIRKDLSRLASHLDADVPASTEEVSETTQRDELEEIVAEWSDATRISVQHATTLMEWLAEVLPLVDEENTVEQDRLDRLSEAAKVSEKRAAALELLRDRLPVFVYFSNYFRVRPRLHLGLLADRLEQNVLDDDQYDRGNECLLKLLRFDARELSNLVPFQPEYAG